MPFKVLTVIAVDLHFVDCLCFQHCGMEYFTIGCGTTAVHFRAEG